MELGAWITYRLSPCPCGSSPLSLAMRFGRQGVTDSVLFAVWAMAQPHVALLSLRSLLRAPGLHLDPAGSAHAQLLEQVPGSLCPVHVRALVGKPSEQVPDSLCPVPVALVGKPLEQAGHMLAALWECSAWLCWSRSMLRRLIQFGNVPAGPSATRCVAPLQAGMLM